MRSCIFYICLVITLLNSSHSLAQSFIGLSKENVITETYDNPAFAVNDDEYQINIFGCSILGGTNAYSFNKSTISSYYKSNARGEKALWANMDMLGPAISFKVKKKYFFAVSTRSRYLANIDHLNNSIFQLIDHKAPDTSTIYNLHNFSATSQLFSELNLMYAGYLYNSDNNNLMGGITLKVLMGSAGVGIGIPDATFNIYKQNEVDNLKGAINVGFTPYANKWLNNGNPFIGFPNSVYSMGVGMDMGLLYTYSPPDMQLNKEGYLARVAISITDIGSINYTASSTTGSYTANAATVDLNNLNKSASTTYGTDIHQYQLDSVIRQTNSKTKFKIGLPTALHINGDFKLSDYFYLNGNLLLNLRKPSVDHFVSHYISTLVIAPRLQYKLWSIGMPFSYNAYDETNIGLVFSIGPAYIGSGSLLTTIARSEVSNADVFLGVAFRIKGHDTNALY